MKRPFKIQLFKEGSLGTCYTLIFDDSEHSEAELFKNNVEDQYQNQYIYIKSRLNHMLNRHTFRLPYLKIKEGNLDDNVVAIPTPTENDKLFGLRWYALRYTNHILILGNGNMKTTNTYQEDPELHSYVKDLQFVDKCIKNRLDKGLNIDNKSHQLNGDFNFLLKDFKDIEYPID